MYFYVIIVLQHEHVATSLQSSVMSIICAYYSDSADHNGTKVHPKARDVTQTEWIAASQSSWCGTPTDVGSNGKTYFDMLYPEELTAILRNMSLRPRYPQWRAFEENGHEGG